MNILLVTSHSIAEHDDLAMLSSIAPTFSIGAYSDPTHPEDDKRPPLDLPYYAELHAACRRTREEYIYDPLPVIDPAKATLPDEVLDWTDVAIFHHYPERWLIPQYGRLRAAGIRVIWRTNGQSNPWLEHEMSQLPGLEIVRYSPNETVLPNYAGHDAIIRFGKDPAEWSGWHGYDAVVGNITQHMFQRGSACGYEFWAAATADLPTRPAGPGSEAIGGLGALPFDRMGAYLRRIRCYLYTGTQPAPYTLGLIEAMMTGVPIVSIGKRPWAQGIPWLDGLLEADEIVTLSADTPEEAGNQLDALLREPAQAEYWSGVLRARSVDLFDLDTVTAQWREFLGA